MIIKRMDSKQAELDQITSLLKGTLNLEQRFGLVNEAKTIKNGTQGEKDAAYHIDFYFAKSKKWAVIHDLRLEREGQGAQIDHILVNRFFDFFVLESKNYSSEIKITPHGEFQAYYGKRWSGIESPLEQNKRHIHFLQGFLQNKEIACSINSPCFFRLSFTDLGSLFSPSLWRCSSSVGKL